MFNFAKTCCICLYNQQNINLLSESEPDDVSYYLKLTASIPEMCFDGIKDTNLICKECCDILNIVYKFREKCLHNKIILIDKINSNNNTNDENNIKREEIYIKTECNDEYIEENAIYSYVDGDILLNDGESQLKQVNESSFEANLEIKPNFKIETSGISENSEVISDCSVTEDDFNEIDITKYEIKEERSVINEENCDSDPLDGAACNMRLIEHGSPAEDTVQLAKGSHTCKICNKMLRKNWDYVKHMRNHKNTKPFECNICLKKIFHSRSIKQHMLTHSGVKPYQCNVCMKEFTRKDVLERHVLVHSEQKKYACNYCGKSFARSGSLKVHTDIHKGGKPFECNVCTKKFLHSKSLEVHMLIHSGQEPFQCNICMKKFLQNSSLKAHMVVHTGNESYQCDICMKNFTRKGVLKTHMLVHTGEKKYRCNMCTKGFTRGSYLIRHMNIHKVREPI